MSNQYKEGPQITSSLTPATAMSQRGGVASSERLAQIKEQVAPDEGPSMADTIKEARMRLINQATGGVDPFVAWLSAKSRGGVDKYANAADAMNQAYAQRDASEEAKNLKLLDYSIKEGEARTAEAKDKADEAYRTGMLNVERAKLGVVEAASPAGKQALDEGYKPGTPEFAKRVREIAAAEKQNSGNDYGQGIVFRLSDGQKVQTRFNKESGYEYLNKDNKYVPIPYDAKPTTAGSGNPLDIKSFTTMRKDLYAENQGLQRLDSYMSTVNTADQGYALMADKVLANINTFFKGDLSEEQFATIKGSAQLQALLGLNREDIVGPGVMTEYDAQRILQALGGDVSSLRNKEVVKSVLKEMFESKRGRAEILKDSLVLSAPVYDMDPSEFKIYEPKVIGKEEKEKIATLSDEDKSRDKARKAIAANPSAKPQILQKLRDAGISVEGL
tara:strand:+ start:548 stop:1882 length:1335 start_codon:yes stop_codon:yes gene_type:complete